MKNVRYGTNRAIYYEKNVAPMDFTEFSRCGIVVITLQGQRFINLHNGEFSNQDVPGQRVQARTVYDSAKSVLNHEMVIVARRRHWDKPLYKVRLVPKSTFVAARSAR